MFLPLFEGPWYVVIGIVIWGMNNGPNEWWFQRMFESFDSPFVIQGNVCLIGELFELGEEIVDVISLSEAVTIHPIFRLDLPLVP